MCYMLACSFEVMFSLYRIYDDLHVLTVWKLMEFFDVVCNLTVELTMICKEVDLLSAWQMPKCCNQSSGALLELAMVVKKLDCL